ncbi:hypothetical protein DWB84_08170 [Saccharophagus sp. K07]|jgi:hypothetical protein|uniref:hypothetical protein n=1 Tax=Saccharophagus sp. K07 TaxID=2283636 RepID=UPI001651E5EF|nr:hypothetical protein [Saccharophagus sp. K07]MBC6905428.1 hypothetical protein [Saccharophagus sp. K07]
MNLHQLKGAQVEQVTLIGADLSSGDVELKFAQGILRIFNPLKVTCDNGFPFSLENLAGTTLTDIYTTADQLTLVFAGRIYLEISLREEDFVRAEAVVFYDGSGNL